MDDLDLLLSRTTFPDDGLIDRLVRDNPNGLQQALISTREAMHDLPMGDEELSLSGRLVEAIEKGFWCIEHPGEVWISDADYAAGQQDPLSHLAHASLLAPKGVICLISALSFHELTTQMPKSIWLGIESGATRPKSIPGDLPLNVSRFDRSYLWEGVTRHRIEGVEVPITDPERTIVDCWKYRNKVPHWVAMEALADGLDRQPKINIDRLCDLAHLARVWNVMKPYLEAMTFERSRN